MKYSQILKTLWNNVIECRLKPEFYLFQVYLNACNIIEVQYRQQVN